MKLIYLHLCIISTALLFCLCSTTRNNFDELSHLTSRVPSDIQQQAVEDLIQRLIPDKSYAFKIIVDSSLYGTDLCDHFVISSNKAESSGFRVITIEGSSGVAASLGFYYYLTQYCGCQVTWGGHQLDLPAVLPAVPSKVSITTNDRFRYYQNVCTFSYSSVWWNWTRWEKEIDWMALRGINLPLAFKAQEAIWQKVFMNVGLTQSEIDAHFGGPGFLSWSRMGNIRGWGGPISPDWHQQQVVLQHKILKRMRSFGMIPVLPGFAGHVPKGIERVFPNASVSQLGPWSHFTNKTYCCTYLLEPEDPLFQTIGQAFMIEMIKEFGSDHVYNADTFNENTPRSNKTTYLSSVSSAIYSAMRAQDHNAIWVLQGWMFAHDEFWQQEQVKAFVTAVPTGKMIILDLQAELFPQYKKFESYYGQPFIWCMLHNFGGTLGLYGAIDSINKNPFVARNFTQSSMVGIGLAPEGIEQNEIIYEFMAENAWRKHPADTQLWVENYAYNRYGFRNGNTELAWQYLLRSVYNCTTDLKNHNKYIIVRRPSLKLSENIWYNASDVFNAWTLMLQATRNNNMLKNSLFRYDLVDVTRQSLQIIGATFYAQIVQGYKKRDTYALRKTGDKLRELLTDMDSVLGSDSHFLLGHWLESAKALGTNTKVKKQYEYNARNQITIWGPNGEIKDYACKQWSGLIKSFYSKRWNFFIQTLIKDVEQETQFDEKKFAKDVFENIEKAWTFETYTYPNITTGDSIDISKTLWTKYHSHD